MMETASFEWQRSQGMGEMGSNSGGQQEQDGRALCVSHALREVDPSAEKDLASITRLHLELLWFGPMAQLGDVFLRRFCYGTLMEDGLLRTALYEVEGKPVGFIAYTARSISFHRRAIRNHWKYVGWVVVLSILRDPRVLARLARAIRLMFSRRAEQQLGCDPMAEVVAIGVLPEYRSAEFSRRTGLRVAEELLRHAAAYFQRAGLARMRMIVDADNKAALFMYHRMGARFEPYEQAGQPVYHIWFDLDQDSPTLPGGFRNAARSNPK